MREKAVKTSCEEYLNYKFLLISNGKRYKPLQTHLKNRHGKSKKPYPTALERINTLMVDYKAPGMAAPQAEKQDKNDQGLDFGDVGVCQQGQDLDVLLLQEEGACA